MKIEREREREREQKPSLFKRISLLFKKGPTAQELKKAAKSSGSLEPDIYEINRKEHPKGRRAFFRSITGAIGITAFKEKIPPPIFNGDWFKLLNEAEGHDGGALDARLHIFGDGGFNRASFMVYDCPSGHTVETQQIGTPRDGFFRNQMLTNCTHRPDSHYRSLYENPPQPSNRWAAHSTVRGLKCKLHRESRDVYCYHGITGTSSYKK